MVQNRTRAGSARRPRGRRAAWPAAFASLVGLALVTVQTASPAATAAPVTSSPTAVTTVVRPLTVSAAAAPRPLAIRGPGSRLPSDRRCADRVQPVRESHRANARYNRRAGSQRLPGSFFDAASHDARARTTIASRVTGRYTGSTGEIWQWVACKWGVDERLVRAQAETESSWRQSMTGDWTRNSRHCAPGHGLGVDGRRGACPESWGVLQVRYRYFRGAFPDAIRSTAFNADTAYAVWRACYEGYEHWLRDYSAPGHRYRAGDAWGCVGRWYSGAWYDPSAKRYIACVRGVLEGRPPCD